MLTLVRASLLAFALVACAWFGLGTQQARDTQRASAIVNRSTPLGRADVARARSLIRSAGVLNPDLTVDTLRGELALDQNQNRLAAQIIGSVTHREPMNLEAWVLLAQATQQGDPRTLSLAVRTIGRLDPTVR
jgi:predicted Zn-dependent protease